MSKQILIGRYDGDRKEDFYREKEGILRVATEYGVMWVPLARTGTMTHKFNPLTELVLIFLSEEDYSLASSVDRDGNVMVADSAFALIVQLPPQYIREYLKDPNDEANLPTKLLVGSDSGNDDRHTMGTEEAKVICTDDMVILKAGGGQFIIGKDGIMIQGEVISMNFFNESRGGVLKESFIAKLVPSTVLTPFPPYLPDSKLLKRVEGIADIVKSVTRGAGGGERG